MSFSSAKPPELLPATKAAEKNENSLSDKECFYGLCYSDSMCKYIPSFRFKSRSNATLCYLFSIMVTLLLIAIIFPLIIDVMIDQSIYSEVVIDSTHAANYDAWQTNAFGSGFDDVKITYNLYFFDVQNPDEILAGEKPKVIELGPYVYNEFYYKFDIVWSDDGNIVTYNNYRYYIFDQSQTAPGLHENDNITLVYPTVIGFEYLLDKLPPEANAYIDGYIDAQLAASEAQTEEVITTLYNLVSKLDNLPRQEHYLNELTYTEANLETLYNGLFTFIANSNGADLLLKILLCRSPYGISPFFQTTPSPAWFGWLNDPILVEIQNIIDLSNNGTNTTTPWSTSVPGAGYNYSSIEDTRRRRNVDSYYTGKKNIHQVSQYIRYQNMTELRTCINPAANVNSSNSNYTKGEEFPACAYYQYEWSDKVAEDNGYTIPWENDYANRIMGTDGNMFAPPLKTEKVQIYISDIYRSLYMINTGSYDWYGITLHRYQIQIKDMDNSTVNPENAQYYAYGPYGLLNSTMASNCPVFISYPHFYLADPRLSGAIEGMNPNQDGHDCYLDIEPQTGLLARARKRLQVNYYMEAYDLPEVSPSSIEFAEAICANISQVINIVSHFPNVNQSELPQFSCNLTVMNAFFECLAVPSKWDVQNGGIFFPYAWTSEELNLPKSDADSLTNTLFLFEDIGDRIRFWGLILAAGCLFMIFGILTYHFYYSNPHRNFKYREYFESKNYSTNTPLLEPLGFAYNPDLENNGDGSPIPSSEPLLNSILSDQNKGYIPKPNKDKTKHSSFTFSG